MKPQKPGWAIALLVALLCAIIVVAIFAKSRVLGIVLASSIVLAILFIGLLTDLLREGAGSNFPYSFSRFQVWLWTMVICPAFCLYWGWHSAGPAYINPTSLILLGISGGTTLLSSTIKTIQLNSPAIAGLPPKTHKATTPRTFNILTDILIDDSGQLSIARLQNLIFTFAYIGIYVSIFFSTAMTYPEFDETAYTLMGISSSTYLIGRSLNK